MKSTRSWALLIGSTSLLLCIVGFVWFGFDAGILTLPDLAISINNNNSPIPNIAITAGPCAQDTLLKQYDDALAIAVAMQTGELQCSLNDMDGNLAILVQNQDPELVQWYIDKQNNVDDTDIIPSIEPAEPPTEPIEPDEPILEPDEPIIEPQDNTITPQQDDTVSTQQAGPCSPEVLQAAYIGPMTATTAIADGTIPCDAADIVTAYGDIYNIDIDFIQTMIDSRTQP